MPLVNGNFIGIVIKTKHWTKICNDEINIHICLIHQLMVILICILVKFRNYVFMHTTLINE